MKNVCVQGLGFVGAAMSVSIASRLDESSNPLFNVIGVDLDSKIGRQRIDDINSGKSVEVDRIHPSAKELVSKVKKPKGDN
mgnify:CR=1 FL=1